MKKSTIKTKKAFTMIELILVIVILGIVSSIGSTLIANVYEQYILQRASHNAALKTELAAQQIANLLSYRIPATTLARNPTNMADNLYVTTNTIGADNTHTLLEWIGSDNDGFSASLRPPWNGFADVDASTQAAVFTPGSDLTLANTIMSSLSGATTRLAGAQYPAIFFRDIRYTDDAAGTVKDYDALTCMGMTTADRSCISSVSSAAAETLTFQLGSAVANKVIAEHYKLAWTAYAVCPVPRANGNVDLHLIYNYQPWEGERLANNCGAPVGAQDATIITNVSVFKFAESGNTFRFKLCAQEQISTTENITICKEKAIIL